MPFQNQLHVDQLLSNISVKYKNAELIAMDVFPELPVKKDSDLYRTYTKNFRIPETKRANKGLANEHYFEVGTSSYVLEDHALKDYVSDDDADNYDLADLRADTTEELTDKILMRLEKSVADLFTTTNWSLNVSLAAGAAFNLDTVASNPIPIFDTGATEIVENGGVMPNFAIIPRTAMVGIKNHQSVLDRIKYTNALPTAELLAGVLGISGQVLEPKATYDTSLIGATSVASTIWGDICFLGYKPQRPGPMQPSCGYVFKKNVPMVRRWREEERIADAIEVRMKYVPKVVASLTGFLIKDVI